MGLLAQKLGPFTRALAYFSKQLNRTAKGWSLCLWAVAATTNLLKEPEKLTFGQPITICTPHQVQALVRSKGTERLSPGRSIQVQTMLLDSPVASTKTFHMLNPATLLPTETGPLEHDRIKTIDLIYSSHSKLGNEPLPNAEEEWFTDRSSFMREGKSLAGYTVTSQTQV